MHGVVANFEAIWGLIGTKKITWQRVKQKTLKLITNIIILKSRPTSANINGFLNQLNYSNFPIILAEKKAPISPVYSSKLISI